MNTPQQLLPGVPWYDISDPSSPTLDQLAAQYDIHELQVEDCRHAGQRAKTEEYEHYIFTVRNNSRKMRSWGSPTSVFFWAAII